MQSAQRSDTHHGPPYSVFGSSGAHDQSGGPRDRALSAYLSFSFSDFPLLNFA
jgi:hypothetical protein